MTGDLESLQLNLKSLSQLTDLELTEIAEQKHCRRGRTVAGKLLRETATAFKKQRVQAAVLSLSFNLVSTAVISVKLLQFSLLNPSQTGNLPCVGLVGFQLPDALVAK